MVDPEGGLSAVTFYQWLTLAMGTLGFLLTWTATVISVTRAVTKIRDDTTKKIIEETEKLTSRLELIVQKFDVDQRMQDERLMRECVSMRDMMSDFEKELHQVELFGRDNYVQKEEFAAQIQEVKNTFVRMSEEIKKDLKDLATQIQISWGKTRRSAE